MATRPSSYLSLGLHNVKNILAPVVIVMGLMCSTSSFAQSKTFEAPEDGFSLILPDDWQEVSQVEISRELAEIRNQKILNENATNRPHYIFRATDGTEQRIVVMIQKGQSRSAKWVLETLSKSPGFAEELRVSEKATSPYIQDVRVSDPVFDTKTGYLWVHMLVHMKAGPDEVKVSQLNVLIPTQNGLIMVKGYSETKNYSAFIPVFHSIVSSITLADPAR